MIVEVYKHKTFAKLTRYALGRGPVIASNLVCPESPALAALEMELEASKSARCRRPALHFMLCPHPTDRIDPGTWPAIIREYLEGMGLEGHLYLATLHDPGTGACPHAHVVVCRVKAGRAWKASFDWAKSAKVAMRIERRHRLKPAPRGGRPAGPDTPIPDTFARPDPAGPAPGIGGFGYVICSRD